MRVPVLSNINESIDLIKLNALFFFINIPFFIPYYKDILITDGTY